MKSITFAAITLAFVSIASATTLVWNTHCDKTIEFCEDYKAIPNSPKYQKFYDRIINVAHSFTKPLEDFALISNIIVSLPNFIPCHPSIVHLMVESHHDTPELRMAIKDYAMKIQDATGISLRVFFKIQDKEIPFQKWKASKGYYILCKEESPEILETQHRGIEPTADEKAVIQQLARRRRVDIQSVWKENDIMYLSVNAFHQSTKIQHFKKDLEQRLRTRVRLLLK